VWDLRRPPDELIRSPRPGVQSALRRFGVWVQDLRRTLHGAVDASAKDAPPDQQLRLAIFKQALEARIDAFDADITSQMLTDPTKLGDVERRFRSAMTEEAVQLDGVSPSIAAALPGGLQGELTRSLTTCPFRHLLSKETVHAT
jgi:hypothetical protein